MSPTPIDPNRQLRHDVRGCLNSIVLSVEVLAEDLDPQEAVEFLDGLSRAADKMIGLMDRLPYHSDGD
jgi:hypothetical protein